MTPEHLSDISGVNVQTIRRLENEGKTSFETLRALGAALQNPVEYFLQKTPNDAKIELIRWVEEEHHFEQQAHKIRGVDWTSLEPFSMMIFVSLSIFAYFCVPPHITTGVALLSSFVMLGWVGWMIFRVKTKKPERPFDQRHTSSKQHLSLAIALLKAPHLDLNGIKQQIDFTIQNLSVKDEISYHYASGLFMVKAGLSTQTLNVQNAILVLETLQSILESQHNDQDVWCRLSHQSRLFICNTLKSPDEPGTRSFQGDMHNALCPTAWGVVGETAPLAHRKMRRFSVFYSGHTQDINRL